MFAGWDDKDGDDLVKEEMKMMENGILINFPNQTIDCWYRRIHGDLDDCRSRLRSPKSAETHYRFSTFILNPYHCDT